MGFDLGYIASALLNHTDIARELVRLFKMRFYLARKLGDEDLADKQQRLEQAILTALDEVAVLNEDRILRRYLALIQATLRTNRSEEHTSELPSLMRITYSVFCLKNKK